MSIELPKPIAAFVEANARLDLEGMLRPFVADAVITDNGRRYEGRAGLRRLLEESVLPVKAVFLRGSRRTGEKHRGRRQVTRCAPPAPTTPAPPTLDLPQIRLPGLRGSPLPIYPAARLYHSRTQSCSWPVGKKQVSCTFD